MRIGLYFDLRNPSGWRRDWTRLYGASLDRCRRAEDLGFDSVWLSEHHLFDDGYLSQPLLFAAAVAAVTSQVRIGTAITIAPLRPAVDLAEQAAIVDNLSGGRLELGLGAGYRVTEFEAYGADIRMRFQALEDRAREVRRLWSTGEVLPPPAQIDVPLWVGAQGPRAAKIAGRLGAGLLWLGGKLIKPYAQGLREGGYRLAQARMAGVVNLLLADDPERAWARIAPHAGYHLYSYERHGAETSDSASQAWRSQPLRLEGPFAPEALRARDASGRPPAFDVVTPEQAVERLSRLTSMPVVEVLLWAGVGGMPDDLTDRHIELVGTRLAPAIAGLRGAPLVADD